MFCGNGFCGFQADVGSRCFSQSAVYVLVYMMGILLFVADLAGHGVDLILRSIQQNAPVTRFVGLIIVGCRIKFDLIDEDTVVMVQIGFRVSDIRVVQTCV